jgi:hypothetical protein
MCPAKSVETKDAEFLARVKAGARKKNKHAKTYKLIEFQERLHNEKKWVQRHYCTLFGFWRFCRFKPCRRARACKGDQDASLKRSVDRVSRHEQYQAREELLRATPRHIGNAEIVARSIMPNEFWPAPVAVKVAEALVRQKTQREFDAEMKRLNQV